jgi:hypothetical protein
MFETGDSTLCLRRCLRSLAAWNVKCLAHDDKIARERFPKSSGTHNPVSFFQPEAIARLRLQSDGRLLIFR